jgi:hypothetical protein
MRTNSKEIFITVNTPPPFKVNNYIPSDYGVEYSWDIKCQFFWWRHKKIILFGVFSVIAVGIALGIVLSSKTPSSSVNTNPCESYKMDDLASSITLECFNYIWTNGGCKGFAPKGYLGWWLRSPEGGKTVPCIPPNIGERCGAGSYGTVVNNIFVCDLNYRGY